eukprot:TRINITY_DN14646_c0_g1_i1.p1 TRINITY_DN14646_c0_g1~~TRINITY_DN14646_c0_g1_i1.p1  ORF type:complete len:269 (+),score=25.61 TRINITY_DN14646_c0_g1_i1:155-961(+)
MPSNTRRNRHHNNTCPSLPLQSAWRFWRSQWANNTENSTELGDCNDVPTFWSLFNNLPVMDRSVTLPPNASLLLFRQTVKPKWEDPANVRGGHFKLTLANCTDISFLWRELAMAAVGEAFQYSHHVCGGSLDIKPKKANSATIWLDTTEPSVVQACRNFLLSLVPEEWITSLKFVVHKVLLKNYHDIHKSSASQAPHGSPRAHNKRNKTPPGSPTSPASAGRTGQKRRSSEEWSSRYRHNPVPAPASPMTTYNHQQGQRRYPTHAVRG